MMKINLSKNAEEVINLLTQNGFEAYVVGGAVRDFLLGKSVSDYDIATSALPEETMKVFEGYRVIETGLKHGTVTVIVGGEPFEITTYRIDGSYSDNRHPEKVTFSRKLTDDLSRRDFTVNAMAYNPVDGLVDPFGGVEDLKNGIIRTVGNPDVRFGEDALRILRCIRFASVLGFEIEDGVSESIKRNKWLLKNISAERIFSELKKLICGKYAHVVLEKYPDVITEIIPELSASVGFLQKNIYHVYDVYMHTVKAIEASENNLLVRLALLFHDCGKPLACTCDEKGVRHFRGHEAISAQLAEKALLRLRCDTKTLKTVKKLILYHDYRIKEEKASVKHLLTKLSFDEARLYAKIRYGDMASHAEKYRLDEGFPLRIIAMINEIEENGECVNIKTLAITGDDLLEAGIPKGKIMGEILQALVEETINCNLPNEKEILLKRAKDLSN